MIVANATKRAQVRCLNSGVTVGDAAAEADGRALRLLVLRTLNIAEKDRAMSDWSDVRLELT